jgi:hypothetical protein
MKLLQQELPIYALLVCSALVAACSSPGYNNNPSQQITNARVGCPAASEFFAVYFSVHVQPSSTNQDARITKDIFRPYCNDIPIPGKVFLTADLVGNELRRTPIGIRIVEQEPREDESHGENANALRTISDIPARTYAKGVIESRFELDNPGHYAIYLIRGREDGISEGDKLIIPLNVGVDSGANLLMTRIVAIFGIASGLVLIGLVAFRYMRKRNAT